MLVAICEAQSPLSHRKAFWVELLGSGPITKVFHNERTVVAIVASLTAKRKVSVDSRQYREWNKRPKA
jgi:hypothetical protein